MGSCGAAASVCQRRSFCSVLPPGCKPVTLDGLTLTLPLTLTLTRLQAGDTRRPQRSQDLTLRPTLHDRADAQHDQHYGDRGRCTRGDRGRGGRCGRRGGGGRGRGRGGRTRVALALRAALNEAVTLCTRDGGCMRAVLNETSSEAHPTPTPTPTPTPNQVLNQTSSEAHKFKLTALFLNRESDKAFFGGCDRDTSPISHKAVTVRARRGNTQGRRLGCELPKGGGRAREERSVAKGLCQGGWPIAKGGESERGTGRGGEEGRLRRAASTGLHTSPYCRSGGCAVSVAEAVWPAARQRCEAAWWLVAATRVSGRKA
eukprot:scaffold12064_cov54-Phaeocystis_antarctica.AAC.2